VAGTGVPGPVGNATFLRLKGYADQSNRQSSASSRMTTQDFTHAQFMQESYIRGQESRELTGSHVRALYFTDLNAD
jgi:hypothetical protein